MATSSWDASSYLNSTSGLLSVLDLKEQEQQNKNMDYMDIDQILDIPDTPDRLAAQNNNGGECVEKESNSSVAVHSGNSDFLHEGAMNRLRGRGRLVTENGHNRRLFFRPRKNLSNPDETQHHSNSIVSPLESSSVSKNAHLFRRLVADKNSKHETKHFISSQHMDRGKALCTKFPSESSACQEDNTVLDLTEQSRHTRILERAFPRGASKDLQAGEIRTGPIATNGRLSLHGIRNSLNTSNDACKGKEKVGDNTCKGAGSVIDRGKGIDFSGDSQPKTEKSMLESLHSITSPRVIGQKRLVRNGCISPHNIARARQLAERQSKDSKDVEQNDTGNVVANSLIDVSDSIAEDSSYSRVKGRGVIHPSSSKEHDAITMHLSSRSPITHNDEANGTSNASRAALGCFEGLGGWRSTRNRSKNIYRPLSDETGHPSSRNDGIGYFVNQQPKNRVEKTDTGSGRNNRTEYDYAEIRGAVSIQHGLAPPFAQASSSLMSESDQVNGRHRAANTLLKRQKKHGSTSSNHGECSTLVFDDSEIVYLGSSGEPSNTRSTKNQSRHRHGTLDPVIEIDELSPQIRHGGSHDIGCMNNDGSDARVRQVEADELLARELQEQLYNELPGVGGGEIDAQIARTLQQEDAQHASSSGSHRVSHPRASLTSQLYRHSQSRSFQNPSIQRGTHARVPTSTRMARLRSRFLSQPPTVSSRERNLLFPPDMDMDMRIHILEALEAAVGDHSDMGVANQFFQVQRDFNENDYEMLLALDENNHQHGGASVDQINNLPQSTVQTDKFEACAICLETPTIGDTIRHLPCLHKFHKDCIDPWLRRRTSCPVCKSCIT